MALHVYAVDRLLKRRLRHGQVQYLVRWTGYGRDEDSWEPRTSFSDNHRMLSEANALDAAVVQVQLNRRTAKRELALFGEIFLQLARQDFLKEIRRASCVKEHCTDRSGLQGGRGRQLAATLFTVARARTVHEYITRHLLCLLSTTDTECLLEGATASRLPKQTHREFAKSAVSCRE